MKIMVANVDDRKFRVESDSGAVYEISYAGSGDADPEYVATWQCSCPAAKHGRDCKHLKTFLASRLMDYGDPYYEGEDIPNEINA